MNGLWTLKSRIHLYKIGIAQLLYQGDVWILVLISKLEICAKPARLNCIAGLQQRQGNEVNKYKVV